MPFWGFTAMLAGALVIALGALLRASVTTPEHGSRGHVRRVGVAVLLVLSGTAAVCIGAGYAIFAATAP